MVQDQAILERLVYQIDIDATEGVVVTFNFEQKSRVSLDYLEKESVRDERIAQYYDYFIAMTNLLSDLCQKRNYVAIDVLQAKFPFDICFEVTKGDFSYAIREVFLNLLKNLWIDISPIQLIHLPCNIKIWDEVGL